MNRISCKLSDLVEVKNGSTPSTTRSDFYDGNIVWITPKDLSINKSKFIYSSERKITKAGFDSCSTSLLPIGSVLLSSRAPIGLLAICAVETCTNQGFKNLVVKKDKLHNEYLYYWLKTKVKYIDSLGTGTTFKEVSKGVIENLVIELPKDLKDQQKIASVLSALDSKIELNNRINAELEAMAKTLYDYWFVQFDFPIYNQDGNLSGAEGYKTSGGTLVWNEELKRDIPEVWEVKRLGDLILKYSDKSAHVESKDILNQGKFPVITQDNGSVVSGFTNEENPISDVPLIVFGDHSCTLRYVDFPFFRGADGTQIMLFSNNLTIYVYLFLKSIIHQIPGYGMYERHYKYLKDFNVVLPKENILVDFQSLIKPIFDKISHSRLQNQKLTELRDWLLPMLMNGQVKVN